MKTPAQPPKVEKVNITWLKCQRAIERILIGLLIFTGLHILIFYGISLFNPDMVETVSVKYAVYIAVACFFCLFVHWKEIDNRFGPKNVPPIE